MEIAKPASETPPPPQLPQEPNQQQPFEESDNVVPKFTISDNMEDKIETQTKEPGTTLALDNFKKIVMHVASTCIKTNPLSSTQISLLQRHLDQLLPRFCTPDHPPYAAMIEEAIEQLNEEEGSVEELISTWIKKKYNDLPWDHDRMVEHHLNLLCKNGDLVQTKDGHYLISNIANEKIGSPSRIPASTADRSLSVGTSDNSFSSSSSSSGSDNMSVVMGKESLQQKNGKLDRSVKQNDYLGKSEARSRKGNGKLGESVKDNKKLAGRTKSSIKRLRRSSKKEDLLVCSEVAAATEHVLMLQEEEKEELNGVASEEYRNSEQPGDDKLDTHDGFQEQENKKKRGVIRSGKRKVNAERKKTTDMQSSRPPKKVVHLVKEEGNCVMTEDKLGVAKDKTHSLNNQNVDITKLNEVIGGESKVTKLYKTSRCSNVADISPPYDEKNTEEVVKQHNIVSDGSPDELSQTQNKLVDNVNEVIGKQTELLNPLLESASEEVLLDREVKEGEDDTRIEVLDIHNKATTKNSGRRNIRKCKQGTNAKEITPLHAPVAKKGSGKRRDMIKKDLAFEETIPISEEMMANNETTGKLHQVQEGAESNLQDKPMELQIVSYEQNLPDEMPKRGRGRPRKTEKRVQLKATGKNDALEKTSKVQDPNEKGKEVNTSRVRKPTSEPGRRRGRPPKSDTSRQIQIIQEQLKTMELHNITGQTMEEENDARNIE